MIKFNTLAAAVASALLLSTGAFAVGTQPAEGEQPYASSNTTQTSTLQRAAVEANAAQNAPADGTQNAKSAVAPKGQALTRAQVKQQTQAAEQAKQGFADASGTQNATH